MFGFLILQLVYINLYMRLSMAHYYFNLVLLVVHGWEKSAPFRLFGSFRFTFSASESLPRTLEGIRVGPVHVIDFQTSTHSMRSSVLNFPFTFMMVHITP